MSSWTFSGDGIPRWIVRWHVHIVFNRRTERSKADATDGDGLGTAALCQYTAGQTSSGDWICHFVLATILDIVSGER